jgi:trehalose-6-phosphatase
MCAGDDKTDEDMVSFVPFPYQAPPVLTLFYSL